jgi:enamine deaminase RidA (YjgF/YER057c/UK114 family)
VSPPSHPPAHPAHPSPSPHHAVQPAGWPPPRGYANATAADLPGARLVFVAGQVGWDPLTCAFLTDDFAAQAAQALANLAAVLRAAGAEPRHLTRLTWYVTDRAEYQAARAALAAAYRTHLGAHYPAMTLLVVQALLEPAAKVEIEATAVVAAG